MLCDKCKKNSATTHIKTVVNGIVKDEYLCNECAENQGFISNDYSALSAFLSSVLGEECEESNKILRCPVCGSSFEEISKTGRLGCSNCYTTFNSQILPYLKRVHGSTKHTGKKIGRNCQISDSPDELSLLKEKIKQLIAEEKYEEAAKVRDKIKELEGKS